MKLAPLTLVIVVATFAFTDAGDLAATNAIADVISDDEVDPDSIIPSVFDRRVVKAVATAVSTAAVEAGVARRQRMPSIEITT